MNNEKICSTCGDKKPTTEFYARKQNKGHISQCKQCTIIRIKNNRKGIPSTQGYRNKKSTIYLGVHVAERLLSNVFSNVIRMPQGNRGYDFICGKGFKVDAKSSCLITTTKSDTLHWNFTIKKNKIADYFALLAFDTRGSLNPLYFWIIPANILNNNESATISQTTIKKWKEYEKPLDKIILCCDKTKLK